MTGSAAQSRTLGKKTGPVAAQAGEHWPADAVERRLVASLVPFARNARTHSSEQITQIAASIREWGWTAPVLVDEQSNIIAGHGRVLAAQQLGLTTVPTVVARGWSEAKKRAYLIADNKLALNAGWDECLLRIELGEIRDLGVDLGLVGFGRIELGSLFGLGTPGQTDPDAVPQVPVEPTSLPGDVWLLGQHRLACGDSTDAAVVERCVAGAKPNLMITDPPYGVAYDPTWRADAGINRNPNKMGKVRNDDRADWREAWALYPGDVAYVWHAGLYAGVVAESLLSCDFQLRSQIIWTKDRFALSRGDYHWQHEPCWYAVRRGATGHYVGGRGQSTRWDIPARDDSGLGHGTQKPVECMRRPINNNSREGEAVYDPFNGSGTAIIAAEMTRRHCVAIEIDPGYVDVAVTRWQAFTGGDATLEGSGETFAEIAARRQSSTTASKNNASGVFP